MKIYSLYELKGNTLEMYGWSDNKPLFNEFKKVREPLRLIEKIVEIPDDDVAVAELSYNYQDAEIVTLQYAYKRLTGKKYSKKLSVLTTNMEINEIEIFIEGDVYRMDCVKSVPYDIFTKKILHALDLLGYTFIQKVYNSDCIGLKDTFQLKSPLDQPLNIEYDYVALLANMISNGGVIDVERR